MIHWEWIELVSRIFQGNNAGKPLIESEKHGTPMKSMVSGFDVPLKQSSDMNELGWLLGPSEYSEFMGD